MFLAGLSLLFYYFSLVLSLSQGDQCGKWIFVFRGNREEISQIYFLYCTVQNTTHCKKMAITGQFHKIIFFSSLVADFPIPSVCEISWAVLNSADFMSGFICQK
jgi:hypothetical protein